MPIAKQRQIPPMDPTFALFERLHVPLIKYYLNAGTGAVKCPTLYNDILFVDGDSVPPGDLDIFKVSTHNHGSVPYT